MNKNEDKYINYEEKLLRICGGAIAEKDKDNSHGDV